MGLLYYLRTSFAIFKKEKILLLINTFGLGVGLAVSIFAFIHIKEEVSFDRFHANNQNIYRIDADIYVASENSTWKFGEIPNPLVEAMVSEAPEIDSWTRLKTSYVPSVIRFDQNLISEKLTYVDEGFFRLFSFPMANGSVFSDKHDVVLTERLSRKLFGKINPVGKLITISGFDADNLFRVSGIINDPPANSSIQFEVLLPLKTFPDFNGVRDKWGEYAFSFFVLVNPGISKDQFTGKIKNVVNKHLSTRIEERRKTEVVPPGVEPISFYATRLDAIHWDNKVSGIKSTDPQYVIIFSAAAFAILVIAGMNYISISLTASTKRALEVSVKKIFGASKMQIFTQVSFESILQSLISFVFALSFVIIFTNQFNQFTGGSFTMSSLSIVEVSCLLLFTVLVGFVSGLYPSVLISRTNPALTIRNIGNRGLRGIFMRGLVGFQFAFSFFLIMSSMIMYKQLQYISIKDLGYNKDQLLTIPITTRDEESYKIFNRFKTESSGQKGVISISGMSTPFYGGVSTMGYEFNGTKTSARVYSVDADFIKTVGLRLIWGRDFKDDLADKNAIIINEKFLGGEEMDITNNKILWGGVPREIIGVVKDFNYSSLEDEILPLFLTMDYKGGGYMSTIVVKVTASDIPGTLRDLKTVWKKTNSEDPFSYTFVDQAFASAYASYEERAKIMEFATMLAIFIASIGLFGLAGITTVKRNKEISIRKSLGATVGRIYASLNYGYLALIVISFICAAPISWYFMSRWLSGFAYKVSIGWDVVLISFFIGLGISFIGVSYHTLKAALASPIKYLRSE